MDRLLFAIIAGVLTFTLLGSVVLLVGMLVVIVLGAVVAIWLGSLIVRAARYVVVRYTV